jgi:hypothetical protein
MIQTPSFHFCLISELRSQVDLMQQGIVAHFKQVGTR